MAAFAPEPIFHLGALPITNTLLHTILIDGILLGTAFSIRKKISVIPGKLQNVFEMMVETFYNLTESISDAKRAPKIFPYFITFFLFIFIANLSGLLPGVGTLGFFETHEGKKELIPLLRGATSDINVTLGLALISVVATHIMSLQTIGIKEYLSRYFSLNPIHLFVGVLEIVSEVTKVISLSFRLFGNIFAGEVVLATVSAMFAFLFPIPFMMLEVIVALVQALVFSMLTMVFMAVLTTPHHSDH